MHQYEKFKNQSFEILSISIDKDSIQWEKAIKEDGLLAHQQILDSDLSLYKLYSLSALPSNFLLDNNGKIIARNINAKELSDQLDSVLSGVKIKTE